MRIGGSVAVSPKLLRLWSLLLLLGSGPLPADSLLGGGLARYSIDGGHPAIGQVDAGGVFLAYQQRNADSPLGFALSLGGSTGFDVAEVNTDYDPFYPPDRAEYGFLEVALRYFPTLAALEQGQVFLALGWGLHSINWSNYVFDQTGEGLSLGGGVQIPLAPDWALELGLHFTHYTSSQYFFTTGQGTREDNRVIRAGVAVFRRFNGLF